MKVLALISKKIRQNDDRNLLRKKLRFQMLFLLMAVGAVQVNAQHGITGEVKDANTEDGIPMATVSLLTQKDSALVTGTTTDLDGNFEINGVKSGRYLIKIQYLGYGNYMEEVGVEENVDLGVISMMEAAQTLTEINVVANRATGKQKGDTTQINADAYTTLKDASGQDLVEKMPGIMMEDGKLQAQGEEVTQIFIDGKPFFGTDVKLALESIPADMVASVEIYDKKSDKAEMSGFDDGEEARVLNIVTKPDRKRGQFGKTTAGYGDGGRYQAGASVNFFNNDRRITVTGLSNNVNIVNYSADPNSQDDARTQDGIINTNSIGLQFSDEWWGKVEVSGSYQYSHRSNEGESMLSREYILASDSGQIYSQEDYQNNLNQDHRFHLRMEYEINDRNKLIFVPNFSLTNDDRKTGFQGRTLIGADSVNATLSDQTSDHQDNDYGARLVYNHRFDKPGRSVTLYSNTGYHTNAELANRIGENKYYEKERKTVEDLFQESHLDRTGLSWYAGGSFTEGWGKHGMLALEYKLSNRLDDSDRLMYDVNDDPDLELDRLILDTTLSNTFNSKYLAQNVNMGYQFKTEKLSLQAKMEYEKVDLRNDQHFPKSTVTERTNMAWLPSMRMNYKLTENQNIEFNYFTWTDKPSVGQLQEVINDSNPLRLVTGNPELDPTYVHRLISRFRLRDPDTDKSFYMGMSARIIEDFISNSTLIASAPLELDDGILLEQGSQLVRPVNVDGYWNLWAFANYGQPIHFIKSNLNIWAGTGMTNRPGVVNEDHNMSESRGYRGGISLSSNISDRLDFNLSTRSSYNHVNNSLQPQLDNDSFNQRTRLRYNWIFLDGFIYRADVSHRMDTGLADGFNNSVFLVNMSLGKKVLPEEKGEISLNVYDLFGQNNNIRRTINELYIQDRQNTVLQQYFMLSFTYNIRHFSKGASIEDFDI